MQANNATPIWVIIDKWHPSLKVDNSYAQESSYHTIYYPKHQAYHIIDNYLLLISEGKIIILLLKIDKLIKIL